MALDHPRTLVLERTLPVILHEGPLGMTAEWNQRQAAAGAQWSVGVQGTSVGMSQ